jgi:DNA modification methylase
MTPYYQDDWLTVYQGDCRAVMAEMEPESVHCVVTSPPYWGLRDYGTATWVGGDEGCDHVGPPMRTNNKPSDQGSTFHGGTNRGTEPWTDGICGKCGAIREDGQLGLEPTPEAYVANMVAVFREVRRVLRDDGTVWLNLGDSYASDVKGSGGRDASTLTRHTPEGLERSQERQRMEPKRLVHGLKPKDLVGIPWRVAFALQADGWYLRSEIIWSKPNPMPESVTDRPTKSHEQIFLLTKSARYYFDNDAVREGMYELHGDAATGSVLPAQESSVRHVGGVPSLFGEADDGMAGDAYTGERGGGVQAVQQSEARSAHMAATPRNDGDRWREVDGGVAARGAGRNIRSVWTVATQPYPGAHFATFPEKLIEPCIKAGSPPQRGVILDPFAGSGTTGRVAQRLGRRAVLIDLNGDYLTQAMTRNQDIPLGLETA